LTFTYSSSSISTNLAKVRLRLGDTNSDDPLLTDEEINYFLDVAEDDIPTAALKSCRAIVAKFARTVNDSAGGINSSKTSKFQQYRDLLAELEEEVRASGTATPHVGGISIEREDEADSDTDFRPQAFAIGMHDTSSDDEAGS
jgi:hypothetical protein